jgi:hypothetical protein
MIKLKINKEHIITIEEIKPKNDYTRFGKVFRLGKELPQFNTMFKSNVLNKNIKKWFIYLVLNPKLDSNLIHKVAKQLDYILVNKIK